MAANLDRRLRRGQGYAPLPPSGTDAVPQLAKAMSDPQPDSADASLRILEALLFAASEPLDARQLAAELPAGADVQVLLARLKDDYAAGGVQLVQVAGK